jgi:Rad3-related DNA helicase
MSLKKDLDKFFPRKEQQDCINFIDETHKNNKDVKFFLLNLPVGIGKSHLSLMIADWYSKNVNYGSKFDIITNSKILQDQYTTTYDSISDLKGKDNYYCSEFACSCAQGMEFNRLKKSSCKSCPYNIARDGFISGKLSLTNFYLYTLYALYMPKMLELRGANVLIVDECHEYDDVMSNFISIKMTDLIIKRLKFVNESDIIKKLKSVKNISNYIEFLKYLDEEIEVSAANLELMIGRG